MRRRGAWNCSSLSQPTCEMFGCVALWLDVVVVGVDCRNCHVAPETGRAPLELAVIGETGPENDAQDHVAR